METLDQTNQVDVVSTSMSLGQQLKTIAQEKQLNIVDTLIKKLYQSTVDIAKEEAQNGEMECYTSSQILPSFITISKSYSLAQELINHLLLDGINCDIKTVQHLPSGGLYFAIKCRWN